MKVIEELEGLVSSKWEIFKSIFSLVKLEARLAGISAAHIFASVLVLFVILITTWLMLMVLIGYGILLVYPSPTLALTVILLINIVIVGLLIMHIMSCAQTMSFEKSRRFLFEDKELDKNDQPQGTDVRDSELRERIAVAEDRKL